MEQLLTRALAFLACLAAAVACRNESAIKEREKRALEESVSAAKDAVHKMDMKEIEGGTLSEAERAERKRLKEQAEEDENGGDAPAPAAVPPPDGGGN